ncbi:MAG TPA: aspartyl/asparaginyl beta-hydroxylase domain-containing protein [Pseudolabrys sp.]|jgi:hypothetical protein|nr:aspartyl/asparaginyl beta-hydroxylase domain-containing protein [Pseudolabrys sp.]
MREPFPDRLRLPLAFNPAGLASDLAGLSGIAWTSHFVEQNYQGDWSVIALRAPASARHPIQMIVSDPSCTDYIDTPALAASPYFRQVLAAFACPLLAVRLMRLAPGSVIKEHHDHDLSFEQGTVRIHVPVITNDGVDFRLNGRRCPMPAGSAWYLRLSDPHSVVNHGPTDRVHMVIDAAANGWLRTLLAQALGTAGGRAA